MPGVTGFHRNQASQKISGKTYKFSESQRNVRLVKRDRGGRSLKAVQPGQGKTTVEQRRWGLEMRERLAFMSAKVNHSGGLRHLKGRSFGNLQQIQELTLT